MNTIFGKHSTHNKNDNYYGSGVKLKKLIEKFGKKNFFCIKFASFENEDEAYFCEEFLIRNFIKNPNCLNKVVSAKIAKTGYTIYKTKDGKNIKLAINDPLVLTGEVCSAVKGLPSKLKGRLRPDISERLKGRKVPLEVIEKIKNTKKGRPLPESIKQKLTMTFTEEEKNYINELKSLQYKAPTITKFFNQKFNKNISRTPIIKILKNNI